MSERLQQLSRGIGGPPQRGFSSWIAGRARRREYWLWVVPLAILLVVLGAAKVPGAALIGGLPILFVWIRRLHDLGRSGWFAPVINVVVNLSGFAAMALMPDGTGALIALLIYLASLVVMGVLPGEPGSNKYGAPPGKRPEAEVFS